MALTRGDGERGQPVTEHMSSLVRETLPTDKEILQIVGEVVAPATIKNARNYAAGALNLKNITTFQSRDLTFVAYAVQPYINELYTEDMKLLHDWGFETVINTDLSEFPTDGLVVRTDNYKEFEAYGYTQHHPKGMYALKDRKEGIVTTLRHVTWNVGRTGVVSPIAIFDPIEIDGATITRATLHNMKYIEALNLEEGCKVRVIRSGDIIPRIIERVE